MAYLEGYYKAIIQYTGDNVQDIITFLKEHKCDPGFVYKAINFGEELYFRNAQWGGGEAKFLRKGQWLIFNGSNCFSENNDSISSLSKLYNDYQSNKEQEADNSSNHG